ncbi:MAG: histidine phosphatase family protein [Hyphomicrobiales bacterium]
MRLILVRHGQSEGNATGVIQGHLDFGLTELGLRQAEATAERLAREGVERILTSPLLRASATAQILAAKCGLEIEPEPGLSEYGIGEVAGLTGAEVAQRHPEIAAAYRKGVRPVFPGEEGRERFYERIRAVFERWKASGQTTAAITHGGVISALCYDVLGLDHRRPGIFQVANCSMTIITLDRMGRPVILRHNDTCHLDGIVTVEDPG